MKTKILNALKTKFSGVNATILDRIATMLAKTVTSEDQIQPAVEGISTDLIQLVEAYGDTRATEAQKTAVANYETKYGLKDGKAVEPQHRQGGDGGNGGHGGEGDDMPAWAKSLVDSVKDLAAKQAQMETRRTGESRKEKLSAIYGKLPEALRKPYERLSLESLSEEEFNTLSTEITGEVETLSSELKAKGAVFSHPGNHGGGNPPKDELTEEQRKAINTRTGTKPSEDGQFF